ncbi:phage late control D family protein [Cohnella sp. OV330]|uniref:phage late control D family protein n=1 Tax=Cohnella sp. OV330 TaxID=1855288 RepID=UPI000B7D8039|nr:contractile injection system protein, VgrG/Pvc8 family [Cohnella sp. OV330]
MMARQVALTVEYNGKDISETLSESLIRFEYGDNASGLLDDLAITLEDAERRWQGPWSPAEGDTIVARIKTINWDGPNEFKYLPCGKFEIDTCDTSGAPDTVAIGAVSLPAGSTVRRQRNTRAWEKVTLKTIAADVAKTAGLKLRYEAPDNPTYDRLEQREQSDLGFLVEQCAREGIAVKISSGQLVLFDEAVYEAREAVCDLVRGADAVISHSFNWSIADAAYRACELTYTDTKSKTLKATYTPPGAPKTGPTLKVNESAASPAEALRIAKQRLREKNKNYGKASLSLAGDVRMAASSTINVKGWGRFDGKYIIESARHTVDSSGYRTDIQIRKVLGW